MFVTLEGPEGSGKTTLMKGLAVRLEALGHQVAATREPGEGPVGAQIRELLLHGEKLEPLAEVFLFLADRANHVESFIRPALAVNKIVLCDRYADSTIVYQGYGRGLDLSMLRELNTVATGGLRPDLTLLLDLDPALGLQRIVSMDRLDAEPLDFHERVREGFLAEASLEQARWHVLNAEMPPEMLAEAAAAEILARIGLPTARGLSV
ncbi:MAG: dTMP kinase [Fimbriimonadaceae bacterium]